ncbi:hypothetical protein OG906_33730 [Streptomyces sp. NBC_01426]|uniref:hypothetical protein n=1 Tax=Streptomyces sp. NBC_01426 TaxID=2975866 RepID=UPI002E360BA9|nr:hypothetical protein [Streptomyces sp. NBC_01426]
MEIVYASLTRRHPGATLHGSEAAEAVDALWAHAQPGDGLQHASARLERDRIDFLLYLLTLDTPTAPGPLCRAHILITRSQKNSLGLRRRYLTPAPHIDDSDHTCP